jgi:hypothetical protein
MDARQGLTLSLKDVSRMCQYTKFSEKYFEVSIMKKVKNLGYYVRRNFAVLADRIVVLGQ